MSINYYVWSNDPMKIVFVKHKDGSVENLKLMPSDPWYVTLKEKLANGEIEEITKDDICEYLIPTKNYCIMKPDGTLTKMNKDEMLKHLGAVVPKVADTPEAREWWIETSPCEQAPEKRYFIGLNGDGKMIVEIGSGKMAICDENIDWSHWHHEPNCVGWNWTP